MSALVVPERQVLLEFPDDPTYSLHHRVLFVRVQDALWVVGSPDYEVGVRDLGTHPERVTTLVLGAPWPREVDAAQVYPFQDQGDLDARPLVMRRTARQLAEVLGAEGMDEDEISKVWVAVQSKDWISAGTEVGLPLTDDVTRFQVLCDYGLALSPTGPEPVIVQHMTLEEKSEFVGTPQANLRVLGDSRDQGGRRHLRFRDAVALPRETEFEDWPHLGSRATKEFLTNIRDGSGNLENYHTNWVRRSGVTEGSAVCHSHAILCESLRLFISYDQVDVSNLAGVEQIVRRIVQDERAVRKNPKHPDYSGLEFVLNQTTDVSGAASTAVFNRWYAKAQRDEAVVLKNARQRNQATNWRTTRKGERSLLAKQ